MLCSLSHVGARQRTHWVKSPRFGPTAEQSDQIFPDDFFLIAFFFFAISAEANADLREQLGGAQTALRAKEAECNALAQERDRLVKKLADQEESHKAALKAVG